MRDTPDAKTNAATSLAALLFLAALAWVSIWLAGPPRVVPESAAASEFSAARAMRHVRAIAERPHPTGSEESERVRRYILGELAALGVGAEVEAVEFVPRGSFVSAARVQNILARVPGTEPGGRAVMLAAHYDSVPTGPGASDDGAGVAALLETLRALKSGPPLRNDLLLLFTDGEELGLLGARGFAEQNPSLKGAGVVLNFEARGAGGPSLMFETSDGNGALIGELAAAAPHPIANSLMYAVYKRLPNDTDMTVFKGAGASGLNFAYADRITSYHTALDNAEELDERSLQHHGSYALSLARRFGDLDLNNLKSRDAVYFNALGPVLIHYSEAWVVPLTATLCLLFVVALFVGLKRRRLSLAGVAAGVAAFGLAALVSALLTTAAWRAARALHAGYAQLPFRTPYDIWPYALGFVFLTVAAFAAVYALLFRKTSAANLVAGALLGWLALLILTTALLPPGSFLFAWPLLFALAAFAALVASGGRSFEPAKSSAGSETSRGFAGFESARGLTLVALAAAPGVCLFAPLVWMFFFMLGLDLAGPFMLLVVLLCGLLVPHFRALTSRRRWLLPSLAALAACGLFVFGLSRAGFDARHRKTDSVFYLLDSDARRARWLSTDAAPDEWTSQFVPAGAGKESLAETFPWMRQQVRGTDAPAAQLPAPDVRVLEDRTEGDTRTLRLRLTSARRAPMLLLYVAPDAGLRRATLEGQTLLDEESRAGEARDGLRISFAAPPPEGLELLLETRAGAPARINVADLSYGLPELPGQTFRPRPADTMPVPSYRTGETTVVSRTVDLTPPAEGRAALSVCRLLFAKGAGDNLYRATTNSLAGLASTDGLRRREMILVTGGTGTTGREIINELRRLGAEGVRALVRDPAKASFIREAGFETVAGDFDRPETLDSALAGVERALLLTPPTPKTFEFQRDFIEAAKRAGTRRVVKFSAIGASASAPEGFGKWHGQAEDYLKQSGLAWTMLQPNFFMQNLLGQAQQIAAEGRIYQPVGDARASFIDVRDIASVAARTLLEDGHEGETYVLTGPDALSFYDVAAKLSAVAGREITYVPITPEQFRQGLLAAGLPEWLVSALERLNENLAAGRAAEVTDCVRTVGKKEPTTFDQFAREHAQAFKGE